MTEEIKADTIRISKKLIDYIEYIKQRYKDEYKVNISIVETSKIIAERATEENLFR